MNKLSVLSFILLFATINAMAYLQDTYPAMLNLVNSRDSLLFFDSSWSSDADATISTPTCMEGEEYCKLVCQKSMTIKLGFVSSVRTENVPWGCPELSLNIIKNKDYYNVYLSRNLRINDTTYFSVGSYFKEIACEPDDTYSVYFSGGGLMVCAGSIFVPKESGDGPGFLFAGKPIQI